MDEQESREPFVTVYQPIAGWKAVLMAWDDEMECHAPWQTGFTAFKTRDEAVRDAKDWAEAEEIECRV